MKIFLLKKGLCLFLSAITITISSHSQYVYKDGFIVVTGGDSLRCMIKIEPEYTGKVYYKLDMSSGEESIAIKHIRSFFTADQYFEKLQDKKQAKMAALAVVAKDSLFYYLVEKRSAVSRTEFGSSYSTNYEYHYFLKKNTVMIEITEENYKAELSELLKTCPKIVEALKDPKTKIKDLPDIIIQYQGCNGQ